MAIFFGDELKSSNSDYPIIDIAENNAKGVVFVDQLTEFTSTEIPQPKITKGIVVVDRGSGDIYIYTAGFTNSDGSGGTTSGNNNVDIETTPAELDDFFSLGTTATSNWKIIGNTPVFGANIYANIGTVGDQANGVKRTFGKYEDGDLVPTNTKTALEVIQDALTSYQEFIASDIDDATGTTVNFNYDIQARTGLAVNSRKFKIRNRNRNSISGDNTSPVAYGIKSIQVDRVDVDAEVNIGKISWNGSAWVRTGVLDAATTEVKIGALNSFTSSPGAYVTFEFDDSVDLSARLAGDGAVIGKYKIIVQAVDDTGEEQGHTSDGGAGVEVEETIGDTASGKFTVLAYDPPDVTLVPSIGDSSQSGTAGISDNGTIRSLGNVDSNLTLTVEKQSSTTTISSIRVYRGTNTSGTLIHSIVTGTASSTEVVIDSTQNDATQPEVDYSFKDYLSSSGVTGYGSVGAVIPSADVASISYTVEITDDGGTSATNDEAYNQSTTISFKVPYFAGTQTVNPANANSATIETIISGGQFLKKANSTASDFIFSLAPGASSSTSATNADVFVPPSIGSSEFCYICIPNNGSLTDIVINGAEPAISEFGGASGKGIVSVTFSNSVSRSYRVYGNGQPGAQGGNTLDLQA